MSPMTFGLNPKVPDCGGKIEIFFNNTEKGEPRD